MDSLQKSSVLECSTHCRQIIVHSLSKVICSMAPRQSLLRKSEKNQTQMMRKSLKNLTIHNHSVSCQVHPCLCLQKFPSFLSKAGAYGCGVFNDLYAKILCAELLTSYSLVWPARNGTLGDRLCKLFSKSRKDWQWRIGQSDRWESSLAKSSLRLWPHWTRGTVSRQKVQPFHWRFTICDRKEVRTDRHSRNWVGCTSVDQEWSASSKWKHLFHRQPNTLSALVWEGREEDLWARFFHCWSWVLCKEHHIFWQKFFQMFNRNSLRDHRTSWMGWIRSQRKS